MRAPGFWSGRPGVASTLLAPFGALYGTVAGWRMDRDPVGRARVPVVCIGNLTAGGAGKTPTALAVAEILKGFSLHPGFLTRGYGGTETGPLLIDPGRHDSAAVGDEPLLLARSGPVVVSADRVAGAALLEEHCNVIIMDDGFQNPALAKTLSLIAFDSDAGLPNRRCMPAGPLRAPLARQLQYADAIVSIGDGPAPELGLRTFSARLIPDPVIDTLRHRAVFAFAGIGRPRKFFDMLDARRIELAERKAFPDHHAYTPDDAEKLMALAAKRSLPLVTTAKDAVRLAGHPVLEDLRDRAYVIDVTLAFSDPEAITRFLAENIRAR